MLKISVGKQHVLLKLLVAVSLLSSVTVMFSNKAEAQAEIAATVNNGVVTKLQVTQRARFLKLTGQKGNLQKQALEELIIEELQFQEGRRVELNIRDSFVENAFENIAKRVGANNARHFEQGLRQSGVNPNTLKQRLKAQILWAEFVRARTRIESQPKKKRDITSILFNRGSDKKNRKLDEYTLERYVFVVKRTASQAVVNQRIREAEAFRSQHSSCAGASSQAKQLNGVVVTKIGRFTEDTLPAQLRDEVLDASVGTFTKPKRGELGIGVLAVCEKREIVDNSAAQNTFEAGQGQLSTEELQKNSEVWLKELQERSTIRRR